MELRKPLTDAELEVMSVVWESGGRASAADIYAAISKGGCERAAVYQLIHRLIKKGMLERENPGFVCRALIGREEVQVEETKRLVDRLFGGSAERLLVALVDPKSVSTEEIERLRSMVKDVYEK